MMNDTTCQHCGTQIRLSARFCPQCGLTTPVEFNQRRIQTQRDRKLIKSVSRSIGIAFAGTFAAMIGAAMMRRGDENDAPYVLTLVALELAVIFAAGAPLGKRVALDVLRPGGRPSHYGLGVLVGIAGAMLSFLYVILISNAAGGVSTTDAGLPETWAVISAILVAPMLEEWLCRGVLWTAARRVINLKNTLVLTSVFFALLHFLNGATFLELPHRFVGGLLFGWVRSRSGSIWPGVLGHFVWNLSSLLID